MPRAGPRRARCRRRRRRPSAGRSWRASRRPAAQAALDALGDIDRTVEIRDARETIATHVTDLAVAGEGALVIRPAGGRRRRLAAADIAAIRTIAPVVIPEDAFLLIEGDSPREHLATVVIALMLLMFGTFNVAGSARSRRRRT